jgi:uncharacterized membrane protein HdeD (DUF308 family)
LARNPISPCVGAARRPASVIEELIMTAGHVHRGPHDIGHALQHLRSRWGWFVAFGLAVALLGFISLGVVGAATLASVYLVAVFMIVIGGTEISIGLNAHRWGNRIPIVLLGLLYIVAGAFALANPVAGAIGLTLLLGGAMLATGLMRVYFATLLPEGPKWLVGLAGAVTILVGVLILAGWPENSAYVLGIFLGIDMIFYGASWFSFGLFLRRRLQRAQ